MEWRSSSDNQADGEFFSAIASVSALHCIALHCIALHCIALHCIALHCIAALNEKNWHLLTTIARNCLPFFYYYYQMTLKLRLVVFSFKLQAFPSNVMHRTRHCTVLLHCTAQDYQILLMPFPPNLHSENTNQRYEKRCSQ
jgi:hypothetical protein